MSTPIARHRVRRRDRTENDHWIEDMLERAPVGVLATTVDGQPILNSNLFAYDRAAHSVYLHTARRGRTRDAVTQHEAVCFSVFEMGRLLPAPHALDFSVEYAAVVVNGRGRIVTEKPDQRHALQLLMDKYFPDLHPGEDYRPITDDELARTTVFRVDIASWSGKQKREPPEFPGARWFPTDALLRSVATDPAPVQPTLGRRGFGVKGLA